MGAVGVLAMSQSRFSPRKFALVLGGQAMLAVTGFVLLPLIARESGPAIYGEFSMFLLLFIGFSNLEVGRVLMTQAMPTVAVEPRVARPVQEAFVPSEARMVAGEIVVVPKAGEEAMTMARLASLDLHPVEDGGGIFGQVSGVDRRRFADDEVDVEVIRALCERDLFVVLTQRREGGQTCAEEGREEGLEEGSERHGKG